MIATLLATGASCLPHNEFRCATDAECGAGGTCEPSSYCSFPDPMCGGNRFGEASGPYAGRCTGGDAGVDASGEGQLGCPVTYAAIAGGQGNHRYRFVAAIGAWAIQRDACTAESPNAYLAIPDDAGELQALTTFATTPPFWIGIEDLVTEGAFRTTQNMPATFLPWATLQPDDLGNEDCVEASSATTISDSRCQLDYRAICECEP